ncbi:MAG: aminotransferase class V-fold PLP-dependent enzyme [Candidatus Latescibacteria bacterium]|nr:aminotransferase class V-fold PLP-dependent enzyme [Candidatus Latescibacterota bacterium]
MNLRGANWPTSTDEEDYWQKIRTSYMVADDEVYLNTGSVGVQPRCVFEKMISILKDVERSPIRNRAKFSDAVDEGRRRLGGFINAPPEDITFTCNVTVSINMIINGLNWRPGDEILASNHEYGAIDHCLHQAERRYGVVVKRASIPPTAGSPEAILDAFETEFTLRTRLVLCSHIFTRTGLIAPIGALARLARQRGALIAVDGAHAPGMIPLDLATLECDFYGGNCHKWLCAPKGTGFLYVSPRAQELLNHVIVSWGYSREGPKRDGDGMLRINGRPFMWGIENWGTRDQAVFAAVGAAVDFQEEVGKRRILRRGRTLAAYLREGMEATGWARLLTPSRVDMSGSISAFHVSGFENLDLYTQYRITVPSERIDGAHWLRVSTHICNGFDHVDRLIEALHEQRNG